MLMLCCFRSCRLLDAVVENLALHTLAPALHAYAFSAPCTPCMWTLSRCLLANFFGQF
jgi:hypothetical protein